MKYALIIGNDQYTDPKLAKLKTPAADSRVLAEVLGDKSIGDFDEVAPLINLTETEIRRAINTFLANKKLDDLVLIYFSGHGVLDDRGRLFLALKDTQFDQLLSTAISSAFIADVMDSCRSKRQILILDCCHSGAFARGIKAGGQKAVTETTFEGNGFGRVVLTASDSTQYALEGDQVISQTDLSLFTHFLLEGLKTGEADIDNDGYISLDEWYDYAYNKVRSNTPKQVPQKWSYHQQGDLLIAKNPYLKKKVVELPFGLVQALESPFEIVREPAVAELGKYLRSRDPDLVELARLALEKMKEDVNKKVSSAAEKLLSEFTPAIPRTQATSPEIPAQMPDIAKRQKPQTEKVPFVQNESGPSVVEKEKTITPLTETAQEEPSKQIIKRQKPKASPRKNSPKPNAKISLERMTWDNIEFCHIPKGRFLMGTGAQRFLLFFDNTKEAEKPLHLLDIPYNYWMARFPVTNEQYNIYVKATGKEHPAGDWKKQKDHPIVQVSWSDAMAYCKWLNNRLKDRLPAKYVLRLPTEAEWEKAARGTNGWIYPWGTTFDKTKCNTREGGKGDTTPVGLYSPSGDSPYGCADMIGNIWQWTHSMYRSYPYTANDGREDEINDVNRVLRGGTDKGPVRCAHRFQGFLVLLLHLLGDVGFRVAVAPPISSIVSGQYYVGVV